MAGHLRVHGRASPMTVFVGLGETRWAKDDPRRLPYLLLRRQSRSGELESSFGLLFEPYREKPFLDPKTVVIQTEQDQIRFQAQSQDGTGSFDLTCRDGGPSLVILEGVRTLAGKSETYRLAGIASHPIP